MTDFYQYHDKEEYREVKKAVFTPSVVADAIKLVHSKIEDYIGKYLWKTHFGEYKNVSLQDTEEGYQISLWLRAKSALLNRKVINKRKKPTRQSKKDLSTQAIEGWKRIAEQGMENFEKSLEPPYETMKYPDEQ